MATTDRPDSATAGPILIQGFIQYLCQGVILSQCIKFFKRYRDDPLALRVYVAALLISSLLQTALETYKAWLETVIGRHWWTTPLHCTEFLLNGLICTLCEVFLIRRCFKFSQKNIWVLAFLTSLAVTTCMANIYLTVRIARFTGLGNADPLRASSWAFPCWVYGSLVLALSVTSILSASLWRTKTGLNYLDKTLKHIISITWESAALPAACMVVSGVLYSGIDSSEIRHLDLFFIIITAKVYTLGLLRTLNKRTQLRERLHSSDLGRHSLSDWQCDAQAPVPPTVRECVVPNESMVLPAGGVGAGLGNSLPSVAARLGERSDDITFTAPDWTAMDRATGAKSNV